MADKKKIFIADDEEAALTSLKKMLMLVGFEVDVMQDSKDFLSKIKLFKPDLILLDLRMPHFGGLEVCEILNADKDTQGIPIIIVSALAKEEDIKKAYLLGVVGYVTKPYDFQLLLKEINKTLSYKEGKNN
jgi:DNA-binding response OmpR family regulator